MSVDIAGCSSKEAQAAQDSVMKRSPESSGPKKPRGKPKAPMLRDVADGRNSSPFLIYILTGLFLSSNSACVQAGAVCFYPICFSVYVSVYVSISLYMPLSLPFNLLASQLASLLYLFHLAR